MKRLRAVGWGLRGLSRRAQRYVLGVDALAVLAMAVMAWRTQWRLGSLIAPGVFMGGAMVSVEVFRRVGATHRGANRPFHNLLSAFLFGAALVSSPFLAMAVPIPVYALLQVRAVRLVPVKRVFNTAMGMLLCVSAALVRETIAPSGLSNLGGTGGLTRSGREVVAVLAAAAVFVGLNKVMLVGLLHRVTPATPWRTLLGDRESWILALVDVSAGVMLVLAWTASPVFFLAAFGPVLFLQRSVIYHHLVEAARTDAKTGLPNPNHWRSVADRAVTRAQRAGTPVAILMVDLDHFKALNDRFGHVTGDAVLTAVADTLRLAVRPGDLVGRFGGEEFTVLLPDTFVPEALRVATRLRQGVDGLGRKGSVENEPRPRVTASIGVAVFDCHGRDLDELLAAADLALYEAKTAGRNQVCLARQRPVDSTLPACRQSLSSTKDHDVNVHAESPNASNGVRAERTQGWAGR